MLSLVLPFPCLAYCIVVYPKDNTWCVGAVATKPFDFKNRKDLPREWGGKMGDEMKKISGVRDAIFCHKGLFLAVARSKEGALTLAQKALKK